MKKLIAFAVLALAGCGYNSSDVSVEVVHREGMFEPSTLGTIKRVEDHKHRVFFYVIVNAWGETPVGNPQPMEKDKETAGR